MIPKKIISNSIGWTTNRKIVVFESDDWGSIRMPSKAAYETLLKHGISVDQSQFNRLDSLENNDDLECLFEVLSSVSDKNGKNPVFTAVCVVANPDFEKIEQNHFTEYFYEPFTATLQRYPNHDRVYSLWQKGMEDRLFFPQYHGREHLNVIRWLNDLKNGNEVTLLAFNQRLWGISSPRINHEYLEAFAVDSLADIEQQKTIIADGIRLFSELLGYKPSFFVPPNGPFNWELENVLVQHGIKYLTLDKLQKEPQGNGKFKYKIHWLGKKSKHGLISLSRNAGFEPSASINRDWVDSCLNDIQWAFKLKKPATISTHRVNYIGSLEIKNRDNGLAQLKLLLKQIVKRWPDVEFMTSVELGQLFTEEKNGISE